MDISTIATAQASVKALFGLAKGLAAATVDSELKARLIEIQAGILDAQAKLGDAQAERLDLLLQVAELKDKLRVFENSHNTLNSYQLHEIEKGRFLYKCMETGHDAVSHFACPTCYDSGKVTVLQTSKTGSAQKTYFCNTCKFYLSIGDPDPVRVTRRSDWVRNF